MSLILRRIFITLILSFASVFAAQAGELRLIDPLTKELNQVLKAGEELHKSLVSQSEEQADIGIRDLLQEINQAKAVAGLAKPHERAHLIRILDGAKEQFELTQSSYGEERKQRLENGFNQLVNLVRIYKVDRVYGIFFCPKDKTTWVQKGLKAQNPFRQESQREPCGIRVTK
jgi:hypothetical protein